MGRQKQARLKVKLRQLLLNAWHVRQYAQHALEETSAHRASLDICLPYLKTIFQGPVNHFPGRLLKSKIIFCMSQGKGPRAMMMVNSYLQISQVL
ncbi:hypothetical protein FGO68_gene5807 [Halteria grandinella]|uniref:Uncharacterized protein n=1 Tax=Halteria grandinella TaxID=5974 RepID=A0A8J8NHI3_HALGN|nr:hypothetical protein FGO68_gene5807 [Halteria grandinella]